MSSSREAGEGLRRRSPDLRNLVLVEEEVRDHLDPGLLQSVVCVAHSFSLPGEVQYCLLRCFAGYPEVIDHLLERPAQDSVEVTAGGDSKVVDWDASRDREDCILVHQAGCCARDEVG